VLEARSPIFPCNGIRFVPGPLRFHHNDAVALGPFLFLSGSVKQKTRRKSPTAPFPIMTLLPLIRYSSPSRTAIVDAERVSLPASGSVMANPMMAFPSATGARNFCFCSSVPNSRNSSAPKETEQSCCPSPGSTFQNSSRMMACSRNPSPAPPHSSSMKTPKNPSSPAFLNQLGRKGLILIALSRDILELSQGELPGRLPNIPFVPKIVQNPCFSPKSMRFFEQCQKGLQMSGKIPVSVPILSPSPDDGVCHLSRGLLSFDLFDNFRDEK
jgi:hypothetical protein